MVFNQRWLQPLVKNRVKFLQLGGTWTFQELGAMHLENNFFSTVVGTTICFLIYFLKNFFCVVENSQFQGRIVAASQNKSLLPLWSPKVFLSVTFMAFFFQCLGGFFNLNNNWTKQSSVCSFIIGTILPLWLFTSSNLLTTKAILFWLPST